MRKLFLLFMILALFVPMFSPALSANAAGQLNSPVINGNKVTFHYQGSGSENSVEVSGDFNGWASGDLAVQLSKSDGNVWSATITVSPGVHKYKLIVDGKWMADPLNPNGVDDGYGGKNSVFVVGQSSDSAKEVILAGSLQTELGADKDWDPAGTATRMTYTGNGFYAFIGTLPAGHYEYKIAVGRRWDENYGAGGQKNGGNISLDLSKKSTVIFYYNDNTHKIADSTNYQPLLGKSKPRLVGDLQPEINAGGKWKPAESDAFLVDDNFDNVYTYTSPLPKGHYEFKIVLGDNWKAPAYPSQNAKLDLTEPKKVTFSYNADTRKVSTDYFGKGVSHAIHQDKLYHNTWERAYRNPFGAVAAGTPVTLRLRTAKGDLTGARIVLKNQTTGDSHMYDMKFAGSIKRKAFGEADFWQVTFTPNEKGIYGYKFIAEDGPVQVQYGEDASQGGTGKAGKNLNKFFQMTVYDPDFHTPDWMKTAVVYQIFPDRFRNGNPKNDDAKKYSRGFTPIEHRDWNQLPDDPNLQGTPGYNGDGIWTNDFFGGDIRGIRQKLGYLQSLGVNTIYLNPINMAASNHKYDATNYKKLDPMFGTLKEFKKFAHAVHQRGMHLIVDGVFNHVGDDSIYFDRYGKYKYVGAYEYWSKIYDLMNQKGLTKEEAKTKATKYFKDQGQIFSKYHWENWFNIQNKKVDAGTANEHYKYQGWWGYDSLPEIASVSGDVVDHPSEMNNPGWADYILFDKDSVAKTWLDRGASGWRLDVANEVDPAFWRAFRNELKNNYESPTGDEPLILGEIWDDASKYLLGDLYDSVMNYRFRGAVLDFLRNQDADGAAKQLKAIKEDYPKQAFHVMMNLIDSHDTARAAFLLGGGSDSYERAENDPKYNKKLGDERLKLALLFQMGYPGAPTIYYGDEAGVTGSGDPDDRRTYPWKDQNKALIKFYKKVGQVRTKYRHLFSYGEVHTLYTKDAVYAYARSTDKQFAIVAINDSKKPKTIQLDVKGLVANGMTMKGQLDKDVRVKASDGTVTVTIPAMSGRMLVSETGQMPDSVSDLQAKEGSKSVTLSWNGNAEKYNVYVTTIDGAFYKKVKTTSATKVTLDGLENGRKYYFAVTAVDKLGNESKKVQTDPVIPHYPLKDGTYQISNVTALQDGTIDLSEKRQVSAAIWIDGATESGHAEGLIAKLQVKSESGWTDYEAKYNSQDGKSNVFSASFLPIQAGTYTYRMAFSTDAGRNWVYSDSQSVTYKISDQDTTAPASSVELNQPKQESGQVNLVWSLDDARDPYMYAVVRDGSVIQRIWDPNVTSYKDRDVENGTAYHYKIRVFDQAGNMIQSNEVTVTPDIVMVDVTFKVHAPDYTPLSATLTIPNNLNGWNTGAWEMSRNGATSPDWSYSVKLPVGTKISYKYARGNSWDHEGLADHTPNDPNDDDVSYYGYGSTNTNLAVTVRNEGGNQMVIDDTILRWIDQPVVVTSPKNGTTVGGNSVTIKGSAIKDGVLTINGEQVPINDDMTFSYKVNLQPGKNEIKLHIEPSAETKQDIFKGDSGAIDKATDSMTLTIYSSQ
ncbi:MAG TPA: alpha-amylase family glycosyl hydrolase [Bacillales bacterium]|nr:alpha-amylase family glycosyl hydrolase [Bacillales bacterium]